uniref:Uncharacterized protein n=1 Tax=Pinguiococcus pyrenoidosus TaxID=172671 RepID=A0A7R9U7Z8_9STRA|mmetsp:Transcript_18268/g.69251  ORF Transcript_18268/g.69251 Transcript_18268/m.69251 type:complete len:112 (+) Transcript_18268:70-405(+)
MATEASYTRFERAASPTATTTTEDPKRNNDDANNGQANDDSDAEQKDVEAGCALARGRRAARAADTEWRLKVLMLVGGACGVYVLNLVALALYDALDFEERLAAQSLSAPC